MILYYIHGKKKPKIGLVMSKILLRKAIRSARDQSNSIVLLVNFKKILYDQIVINNCFKD